MFNSVYDDVCYAVPHIVDLEYIPAEGTFFNGLLDVVAQAIAPKQSRSASEHGSSMA